MARPPQNDDAFFREVDENLRQDQFAGFARQWGPVVVTAVLVALVVLAAALWWRNHRGYQAGLKSETLAAPLDQLGANQPVSDPAPLRAMAADSQGGYQAVARLALAADSIRRGDVKAASADYAALAGDADVPQPIRDVATLRGVTLDYDTLKPDVVIDRLKAIAVPGNAFFPSAGELSANAYLAMGQKDRAGQLFAAIAKDTNAPASLRARAAGLALSLGQSVAPLAGTP